jgi:hypothetical protein
MGPRADKPQVTQPPIKKMEGDAANAREARGTMKEMAVGESRDGEVRMDVETRRWRIDGGKDLAEKSV